AVARFTIVYVEPEVGKAIRSAIVHQLGSGAFNHSETLPLQFNHDSKHFAYKSLSFPRIDIRQNLGQPESKISSATLWVSGNWHAITLDGTPDGQNTNQVSFSRKSNQLTLFFLPIEAFERASRESASELKSAFERLKHS
ncbi:hypothetical protein LB504_007593, partial [Fusarium proliferatum]